MEQKRAKFFPVDFAIVFTFVIQLKENGMVSSGGISCEIIKEKTVVKRCRSNTLESIHIEVIITNDSRSTEVFNEMKEALLKMRRLRKISYAITEFGFEEWHK